MKRNSRRITRGEVLVYTLGTLCFLFTIAVKVFASASISNLKMDIEKINYKIESQEKKNQSLVMQVNELTSYEKLNGIIKEMGLAYNNENIKVIK